MVAVLFVLLIIAFVVADILVRAFAKRRDETRARREREAVLTTSVQLSFADEAKSLKRAEVPHARARILAVDDEPVVLDSFRKILVLAGFSVDTVESGPEALSLLRSRDYDFLFTDLKMPVMDGVEVVKAARHLRPDTDVVVITGYGSIETAVATMQFGAVNYVQKPFTEEELVGLANKLLIQREARHEAQARPTVRVVAPAIAEIVAGGEWCVPGGAFVSPGHVWARIDPDGEVLLGLDDFARKALKEIDGLAAPAVGAAIRRGDVLFHARRGDDVVRFRAAVSGTVTAVNEALAKSPRLVLESPYDQGWVCAVRPSDLSAELGGLRIGKPVISWMQDEVVRLQRETRNGDTWSWADLEAKFFGAGVAPGQAVTGTS